MRCEHGFHRYNLHSPTFTSASVSSNDHGTLFPPRLPGPGPRSQVAAASAAAVVAAAAAAAAAAGAAAERAYVDGAGLTKIPVSRVLHSFTVKLNVSAFCGIGGVSRGSLWGDWGMLGGIRACLGCAFVSETAQVVLRIGRM
jgi:hypothetical protein